MWILFTLGAALAQTFRNIFSKKLTEHLPGPVTSLCRFAFGAPWAMIAVVILLVTGQRFSAQWFPYLLMCGGMAVFQLMANVFLVELFRHRNFAVSMTLIKTEAIILAVLGIFTLGEIPSPLGWAGILLATVGLLLAGTGGLDRPKGVRELAGELFSKPTLMALGAGISLATCSVFLKKSYLFITTDSRLMQVTVTLAVILLMQSFLSLLLMRRKDWAQIRTIARVPAAALLTGFFAVLGSFCWFTAFSLQFAAYVRTLGQVEFLFGLAASYWLFREKTGVMELTGMAGVAAGTVLIILT